MNSVLFARKILMFKKGKQPSCTFCNKKFMLGCLDDKYFLKFSAGMRWENNANV